MSEKIKANALSYDSNLPPFLQRLRALHSSNSADGRHANPVARPKRVRCEEDEEEDEPTYIDENGNQISNAEMNDIRNARSDADGDVEMGGSSPTPEGVQSKRGSPESNEMEISKGTMGREREKMAAIGAGRRRKVGRVVGAGGPMSPTEEMGGEVLQMRELGTENVTAPVVPKNKPKKKTKKVKLSFGDGEEL